MPNYTVVGKATLYNVWNSRKLCVRTNIYYMDQLLYCITQLCENLYPCEKKTHSNIEKLRTNIREGY